MTVQLVSALELQCQCCGLVSLFHAKECQWSWAQDTRQHVRAVGWWCADQAESIDGRYEWNVRCPSCANAIAKNPDALYTIPIRSETSAPMFEEPTDAQLLDALTKEVVDYTAAETLHRFTSDRRWQEALAACHARFEELRKKTADIALLEQLHHDCGRARESDVTMIHELAERLEVALLVERGLSKEDVVSSFNRQRPERELIRQAKLQDFKAPSIATFGEAWTQAGYSIRFKEEGPGEKLEGQQTEEEMRLMERGWKLREEQGSPRKLVPTHVTEGIEENDITEGDMAIVNNFYKDACHAEWCEFDEMMLTYAVVRARLGPGVRVAKREDQEK